MEQSVLDFFFGGPVAPWLNGAILIVVVASVIEIGVSRARVRRNRRLLRNLRGKGLSGHSELHARVQDADVPGIVQARVETLSSLKRRHQPIDHEMLAAITAEQCRREVPFARWSASALVLLGLAGTLAGLSLALIGLSGVIGPGALPSAEAMAGAILETLDGMKLAFSTTLSGVIGAVFVTGGISTLRRAQSTAILDLEEVTARVWLPLFQTSEAGRLEDAVKEMEATRKELEAGLDRTVKKVHEGFQGIEKAFHQRSRELFEQLGTVRDSMLYIIGERDEDSPSLAEYVATVEATTDGLLTAVSATEQLMPKLQAAIEETIRVEQEALRATLSAHTEAVLPVLERQESAAKELSAAVEAEIGRLADVHTVLERLGKSLDEARATWERADTAIERMGRETADALRSGLAETLEAVAELTHQQALAQERMAGVIERFEDTNRDAVKLLQDQSQRTLAHSQEVVGEIRKALRESLEEIGRGLEQSEDRTARRVTDGLAKLALELRDLAAGPRWKGTSPPDRGQVPEVLDPDGSRDPLPLSELTKDLEGLD